jgi:hypothetical protein
MQAERLPDREEGVRQFPDLAAFLRQLCGKRP